MSLEPRARPPYKSIGLVSLIAMTLAGLWVYLQFQGTLTPTVKLTMIAERAGLMLDPGTKVTYNGVEIGRLGEVSEIAHDGKPAAKLVLDVIPKYIKLIPANVAADIKASTVFGSKYVALMSPKNPTPQPITPSAVIDATSVTTEFNSLFDTLTAISARVDPVKLNLTLSAAAQALTGLGDKFGAALVNGNTIVDDVNPQLAQARYDIQRLTTLSDVYAKAAPDLWDAVDQAVTSARTLNRQQGDLDAVLLAAAGVGNTGADVVGRGGPYLARGAADLIPTSQLLHEYSPEIVCSLRNYHDAERRIYSLSYTGYTLSSLGEIVGMQNPYVYPENLSRVNARGGPGGRPGCWQPITRELWPAPVLVMDTGASLVPYNHFELGSPLVADYVWGRQLGDNTINP
jgi:phospholipid/cholesterol/gamma-HCH transport system substrate-binding protein